MTRKELARVIGQHRAGQLAEAEASYAAYLARNPNDFAAMNNAAALALQTGNAARAVACFEKLVAAAPQNAQVRNNLGYALIQVGRTADAIEHLQVAVSMLPRYAVAYNNLGIAFERSSRRSDALASFERALELDPAYADAAANLGQLLNRDGETARARKVLERALGMHPGHVGVRIGLAFTDSLEGRLTEARTTLEALAPSEPQNAALWEALGAVRIASGDLDGAETAYRRAADIDPHNPQASFGVAAALLGRGDYDNGWRAFEVRTDGCFGPARRFGDIPQWQGEDLDGTLMIYCEQGLGDVVQFARFVANARARVKDVVFLADGGWRSLAPLLSNLAGIDRLITDADEIAALAKRPVARVSVLSLPFVLGVRVSDLPGAMPYLWAPEKQTASWRERLASLQRPRVGLTWAAYARRDLACLTRQKTIPLEQLAAVMATPGVSFVSLQLGGARDLLDLGSRASRITDLTELIRDFTDTAAIMSQLDLVISSDTSVAHVAGALGKPTWLIDRYNTCWRWRLRAQSSPWYPTMRIFRQERYGDWSAPLLRIAEALAELASGERRESAVT